MDCIVSKVGICSKTRPRFKFVICRIENGKTWIVSKMIWVFIENERPFTVLILENK